MYIEVKYKMIGLKGDNFRCLIADDDMGKEFIKGAKGYPLRRIGGEYYLHCEVGEVVLFNEGRNVHFYHNGLQHFIEDLPWDDDIKLIMKLRYGDCDDRLRYFA